MHFIFFIFLHWFVPKYYDATPKRFFQKNINVLLMFAFQMDFFGELWFMGLAISLCSQDKHLLANVPPMSRAAFLPSG
jgi:hypothetical protein